MKDIHSHLIYGIDDGPKVLNGSLKILKKLENEGVTELVVTPHYIIGTNYNSDNETKMKLVRELQEHTKINIYIGNEVYIDNDIIDYIERRQISTINNSDYLLVELPLNEKMEYASNILFELRNLGIIPIIAHPERYHYLSISDLISFVEEGCLLQGNITSLSGKYGKKVKENLKLLLKKHMIHVLGTDIHTHNDVSVSGCLEQLMKLVDDKMYKDLTERNFNKIINNKTLEPYQIINTNTFFRKEKIQ